MSVIVSLARLVTLPREDLPGGASLRADFFARLTVRLDVLVRLLIGLSFFTAPVRRAARQALVGNWPPSTAHSVANQTTDHGAHGPPAGRPTRIPGVDANLHKF